MATPWHETARALAKLGHRRAAIAGILRVSYSAVRYALDPEYQLAHNRRHNASKRGLPSNALGEILMSSFVEPHRARAVRRVIADPDTIRAAARAFAAGSIDRSAMMAMIDRRVSS
jgi:hypothetical protein